MSDGTRCVLYNTKRNRFGTWIPPTYPRKCSGCLCAMCVQGQSWNTYPGSSVL